MCLEKGVLSAKCLLFGAGNFALPSFVPCNFNITQHIHLVLAVHENKVRPRNIKVNKHHDTTF